MEGFYILAAVVLFCGGASAQEGAQVVLGTCHCNHPAGGNSYPIDPNCPESRICTVTKDRQEGRKRDYLGCLLQYATTQGEDIWGFVQSCIPTNFEVGIYCNPVDEAENHGSYVVKENTKGFTICCYTDNCNDEALFQKVMDEIQFTKPTTVAEETTPTIPSGPPLYAVASISVLSAALFLAVPGSTLIILLCLCYFRTSSRKQVRTATSTITSTDSNSYQEKTLNEFMEYSGSGAGQPLLVHRSIAGQITLHELIGKGRYGRVYKGSYKLDEVAVKVFHTVEKASWSHEVDIYQTCLFCHPNILRFIASDSKDSGDQVELWLITEYCEFGSLYDLLIQRTFDKTTMLHLAYSAICGLDHLHTEIFGHEAKPAIVHRDLKSRNILVKADFTCCIGDLGLALRYDRGKDEVEDPPSKRVGTKRYLAPEIIDESISFKQFELFKRADIYSFGLILWEIALRGKVEDTAEEYLMPYQNMVPTDPSFEDMKKVVVVEQKRPPLPDKWNQSEVFRNMKKLIQQCWLHDSDARLTSQRLKRNLYNLQQSSNDKKETENSSGGK